MENIRHRIIPTLLIKGEGLVKGIQYKNHKYIGDPINAIRIFNEKEVDELLFLDVNASSQRRVIDLDLVKKLADECYMPFSVGGGITTTNQIGDILRVGAEKVIINTSTLDNVQLLRESSLIFGSQAIMASIDYKYNWFGRKKLCFYNGNKSKDFNLEDWAINIENMGAGEIILNCIDNDGKMEGYDLAILKKITSKVKIPVIASCGAGKISHIKEAIFEAGASATAAGSMFVFFGKKKGILINYPDRVEIDKIYESRENLT